MAAPAPPRAWWAAAVALSLATAALALPPRHDAVTAWVLDLHAQIPPGSWFSPFFQPHPMRSWGFRPLSLALLDLWRAAGGGLPSPALLGLRAALVQLAFARAAWAYLHAQGLGAQAAVASLSPLGLGAALFSATHFPELDSLGAALALAGLAALGGPRGGASAGRAALGLGLAVALKESTALLCFAALGATAALRAARGAPARLPVGLGLGLGLPWLGLASPLLGAREGALGAASWVDRLPILEHTAAQLAPLGGPVAALLLAARGHAPRLAPGLLLALALMPPVLTLDHYQTLYTSPRPLSVALTAAALVGLGRAAAAGRGPGAEGAAGALLGLGGLCAAVLLSSAPREDLAYRLLLMWAPLIHALALDGLRGAPGAAPGPALRLLRGLLLWGWGAAAANAAGEASARAAADGPVRAALAARIGDGGPAVLTTRFADPVLGPELRSLGARPGPGQVYAPIPLGLKAPRLPGPGYRFAPGADLEADRAARGAWLLWSRTELPWPPWSTAWIRAPLGALQPIGSAGDPLLPAHSFIEDAALPLPDGAPLRALAEAGGPPVAREEAGWWVLPEQPLDLGWRLILGLPLVGRARAEAALWWLPPDAGRPGPPGAG